MFFLGVGIKETIHSDDSQRVRTIEDWSVLSVPAKTPGITIHYLCGRVTIDGGQQVTNPRFTRTSPIVKSDKNLITTASGSKYLLGKISNDFNAELQDLQYDYNPEVGLLPEFINDWIVGDNWKTI